MGFQSVLFIVTPQELKQAHMPFTLFIGNAHVPTDYAFTPTEAFIENYTELYEKLCSGRKICLKNDSRMLEQFNITTDIGSVKFGREYLYQGKKYKSFLGSGRGYAPYFSPFTFSVSNKNGSITVSTRGSYLVEYADIMGFQLYYPKLTQREAESLNITSEKDMDSYNDYKLFRDNIAKITSALCFKMDGIKKSKSIRVSSEAKKSVPNFDCIKKNGLLII